MAAEVVKSTITKVPMWLTDMIYADFVTRKGYYIDNANYFCVDCGGHTLTKAEKEIDHKCHNVLQSHKCSRHYGYLKTDLVNLGLDVSGVAEFTNNSKSIIYQKSRISNPKLQTCFKGRQFCGSCVTCGWRFVKKGGIFCSLLCKLRYSAYDDQENFVSILERNEVFKGLGSEHIVTKKQKRSNICDNQERKVLLLKFKKGLNGDMSCKAVGDSGRKFKRLISVVVGNQNGNKVLSFRKRRRKGLACRAPLF